MTMIEFKFREFLDANPNPSKQAVKEILQNLVSQYPHEAATLLSDYFLGIITCE